MDKDELEAQRTRLLEHMGDIAEIVGAVDEEMATVSHSNSTAYRSLKHCSGMFIVHSERSGGFTARYFHSDGKVYNISIGVEEGKD